MIVGSWGVKNLPGSTTQRLTNFNFMSFLIYLYRWKGLEKTNLGNFLIPPQVIMKSLGPSSSRLVNFFCGDFAYPALKLMSCFFFGAAPR